MIGGPVMLFLSANRRASYTQEAENKVELDNRAPCHI